MVYGLGSETQAVRSARHKAGAFVGGRGETGDISFMGGPTESRSPRHSALALIRAPRQRRDAEAATKGTPDNGCALPAKHTMLYVRLLSRSRTRAPRFTSALARTRVARKRRRDVTASGHVTRARRAVDTLE